MLRLDYSLRPREKINIHYCNACQWMMINVNLPCETCWESLVLGMVVKRSRFVWFVNSQEWDQ